LVGGTDEGDGEEVSAAGDSGADGAFTLDPALEGGKYILAASKAGYADYSVQITVTADMASDVTLELGPQPVAGVVRIEGDDSVVPGATAVLSGDLVVLAVPEGAEEGTEPQGPTAISNELGVFDFGLLAPGVYTMVGLY
jgi:hypothetical protein